MLTPQDVLAAFAEEYHIRSGQRESFLNTAAHFHDGLRSLTILPTGYGKTLVQSMLACYMVGRLPHQKVVIVSGRMTLADQLQEAVLAQTGLAVYVNHNQSSAARYAKNAQVLVTFPTSLEKVLDDLRGNVSTVIFDESHHAISESWAGVVDALANEEICVAGFTATPIRSDRDTLAKMFQAVATSRFITDGVEEGYLVEPKLFVKKFKERDNHHGQMLNDCLNHAKQHGKTIAFCDQIENAEDYSATVNKYAGSEVALCLHSHLTNSGEIINRFEKDPTIRILFCVDMLREGYDFPPIACVAIMRKVQSDLVYTQMVGRTTRPVCRTDHPTPKGRKGAIARSQKPTATILEYFNHEYSVEEHPIAKILAPPKVKREGVPTEKPWVGRRETVYWTACKDAVLAQYRRMNILTGEVEEVEHYELLGIESLADQLYCDSPVNMSAFAQSQAVNRADEIRKKVAKLRFEGVTLAEFWPILVEEFGADTVKESALFSSWVATGGETLTESKTLHAVKCPDGKIRSLNAACKAYGISYIAVTARRNKREEDAQTTFDHYLLNGVDKGHKIKCPDGKIRNLKTACKAYGVSESGVIRRMRRRGEDVQTAFEYYLTNGCDYVRHEIRCPDGEIRSLNAACREYNISVSATRFRMSSRGENAQTAFDHYLRNGLTRKKHEIKCPDGKTRNLKAACREYGFGATNVRSRMIVNNEDVRTAFEHYLQNGTFKGHEVKCPDGKTRNLKAACRDYEIAYGSVFGHMSRTGEDAQTTFDYYLSRSKQLAH